jgi:peptide/nickel transport system ATP-binding protein
VKNLLHVKHLNAGYVLKEKVVHAVRDAELTLHHREFLGIAGESGCGKSTLVFAITGLLQPPGKVFAGEIWFDGRDLLKLGREEMRRARWKEFSFVFQASMNVLNPVSQVKDQIYDAIKAHTKMEPKDMIARAKKLFEIVHIPSQYLTAYPHQLSGGMKQRVVIATALALSPKLVLMDEPTTALDVVVQRMILQEIDEIRKELEISILFITHDLSLLVEISDRIAIMYAGSIVEEAPSRVLYTKPLHPYTDGLMHSFPPLTLPGNAGGCMESRVNPRTYRRH